MSIVTTIDPANIERIGRKVEVTGTIAFDSSYPTGGEAVTAAQLGLNLVDSVSIEPQSGYVFEYDATNAKIKVYRSAAAATHTHTENTAGSYTQNATTGAGGAISQAALAEVSNTTDLSSLTAVTFRARGY